MFAGARVSTVAAVSARATMSCSTRSNMRVSSSRQVAPLGRSRAIETLEPRRRAATWCVADSGSGSAQATVLHLSKRAAIRTELETGKHNHG